MMHYSALINVMVKAATKAGRNLARDFGEVEKLQVSVKGPSDFVSTADRQSEKTLVAELSRARKDFGIIAEEGTKINPDAPTKFIIDPLDGTTNFLHGIPHFAISIGVEENGKIIAGVIYNPVTDELFWSERGVGTWFNDQRVRVSGRGSLADSVIATGVPHRGRGDHPLFIKEMTAVMSETSGVRRFGAASLDLAYVAAGRYEGFWERGLKPWDVAAGIIMVEEAGGYVTQIDNRKSPLYGSSLLAANERLHQPLQSLIKKAGA